MQACIAVEGDLDLHNPFSSLLELLLAPRVSGICHEHKIQSRFSKRGKEKTQISNRSIYTEKIGKF